MNKKINRIEVRQTAQKVAIRDEQNRRIQFAATHPTQETLGYLNTTLCGLEPGKVEENRSEYGSNKVTRRKKENSAAETGWCIYQPVHCDFVLSGAGFILYGYDFSTFLSVWLCAKGF